MASSYGLPQPHPSNFVLPIPPDVIHDADFDDVLLLKLLSDLRTLVVTPGSSLVLPAQLIILLFSYHDQLADKPGTSIVAFFEFISILDDLHDAFDFSAIPISSSSFSVESSNELHANSRLSDNIDSAISLLSFSDLTVMDDCPVVATTLADDHLAPSDFRPPSIPPVNVVTYPSPNFSAPRVSTPLLRSSELLPSAILGSAFVSGLPPSKSAVSAALSSPPTVSVLPVCWETIKLELTVYVETLSMMSRVTCRMKLHQKTAIIRMTDAKRRK
jgi:hypothetical protein